MGKQWEELQKFPVWLWPRIMTDLNKINIFGFSKMLSSLKFQIPSQSKPQSKIKKYEKKLKNQEINGRKNVNV